MNLCNILQAQILDEHKVVDLEILNLTNILWFGMLLHRPHHVQSKHNLDHPTHLFW